MDKWNTFMQHWPLIGLVARRIKAVGNTRIIDGILLAVISSAISASVATWATAKINESNIVHLQQSVTDMRLEHEERFKEIKDELTKINKDFYIPRYKNGD